MQLEVVDIKIKFKSGKNISLSYEGKLVNLLESIWQQNGDASKENTMPAAFILKKECKAAMEVKIRIFDAITGKYTLTGSCDSEWGFIEFSGLVDVLADKRGEDIEISVEISANDEPEDFFSISGNWTWKITSNNQGEYFEGNATYLELYWLYDAIDYSIFSKGVPVEILRHVAAVYQSMIVNLKNLPIKKALIETVVIWCFYRNPPRYDIYSSCGKSHYVLFVHNLEEINFLLYDYLNSTNDSNALCNCYDMAAVLQLYLKAVGIKEVKYCKISNFGYLKLTPLIGRGLCNNPWYDDLKELPVVPEKWQGRKPFSQHVCCCIDCDQNKNSQCGWIIDACVGPHTGNETIKEYLDNVIDKAYPDRERNPNPAYIECFNGITHINWVSGLKNKLDLEFIKQFINPKFLKKVWKEMHGYYVKCPWPTPTTFSCLGQEWEIFFEEIIAGNNQAMKSWKIRKKGGSIHLKIYILSRRKTHDFQYLFKEVDQSISGGICIRGPSYLGEWCVKSSRGYFSRYLWKDYNALFDVTFKNVTFPDETLLVCLNELAYNHREPVLGPLPPLNVKNPDNKKIVLNKGEKAEFEIEINKKLFIDFHLSGDGLQLIKQSETGNLLVLELIALKPSKNKLHLTAVDKDTVLSTTRVYKIEIN